MCFVHHSSPPRPIQGKIFHCQEKSWSKNISFSQAPRLSPFQIRVSPGEKPSKVEVSQFCHGSGWLSSNPMLSLIPFFTIRPLLITILISFTSESVEGKHVKVRPFEEMCLQFLKNTVFPHIVSAETILSWIWNSKGHSTKEQRYVRNKNKIKLSNCIWSRYRHEKRKLVTQYFFVLSFYVFINVSKFDAVVQVYWRQIS